MTLRSEREFRADLATVAEAQLAADDQIESELRLGRAVLARDGIWKMTRGRDNFPVIMSAMVFGILYGIDKEDDREGPAAVVAKYINECSRIDSRLLPLLSGYLLLNLDQLPSDLARTEAFRKVYADSIRRNELPLEIKMAALRLPELVFDFPRLRNDSYNPPPVETAPTGTLASDEALEALRRKLSGVSTDRFADIMLSMRQGKQLPKPGDRPVKSTSTPARRRRRRRPRRQTEGS